ncbi:MAG: uroporphyrinogen decarboxylase family protein [Deltaproteobacteria bacterium]|nr:uroporphyrinogen decarboxylase family protein [Deltaproteobacteria bacterium]
MTPLERVVATLTGQKPDRVPVILYYQSMLQRDLQFLDYTWEEALWHPRKLFQAVERQYTEYEFDNFFLPCDFRIEGEALGSKVGYTLKTGGGMRMGFIKDWVVKEPKDVLKLKPADPEKDGRMPVVLETIKRLRRKYPDVGIAGFVEGPPDTATDVYAGHYKGFFVEIVRNPKFLHDLLEVVTESAINYAKAMIGAGAAAIATVESMIDEAVSPDQYEEFVIPYHRKIRDAIAPVPYVFHQCEDATPFFDLIVNKVEPAVVAFHEQVDFKWAKEKYGDKVILAAGPAVSKAGNNLVHGTPEDVIKEVRHYLDIGMPGGKFWLTASCEVHHDVKPENLKALVQAARLYGTYN